MSLFFHEGLPRSGKSYAAFKDYIIPALKQGRAVYAYIEGIDHERVAEAAELPVELVRKLLHQITSEQVPEIYKHVEKNALIVIDELQDFWPSSRQRLGPEITRFITQHGHDGLDILCMGQVLTDCHNLWKGRMTQKVIFYKREALGKPDEYTATVFKAIKKGDKLAWEEVTKYTEKYDPKYFGCYKSHTDGTTNKETYMDKRAVIWNNPIFKKWIPIFGLVLVVSIGYIVYLFQGGLASEQAKKPEQEKAQNVPKPLPPPQPIPVSSPAPQPVQSQPFLSAPLGAQGDQEIKSMQGDRSISLPSPPPDAIDKLSQFYRVRLGGFIESTKGTQGYIEWRNEGFDVVERMSFTQLRGLGWMVMLDSQANIAFLQKYDSRYIVTAWPIPNPRENVPQHTIDTLPRTSTPAAQAAAVDVPVSSVQLAEAPQRQHLVSGRSKPVSW